MWECVKDQKHYILADGECQDLGRRVRVCVCLFVNSWKWWKSVWIPLNCTAVNKSTPKAWPLMSVKKRVKKRAKHNRRKENNREAGKGKKEPSPAADIQTGWLGWGMVSQKHLREADCVTMATQRPDRQPVLSLLWLMPAARRALAIARHTRIQWVWQANESNTF